MTVAAHISASAIDFSPTTRRGSKDRLFVAMNPEAAAEFWLSGKSGRCNHHGPNLPTVIGITAKELPHG